jgi:hypothetical protein
MKLMGANALLAARHQHNGLQRLVQWNAGMLQNSPNLNGELALAVAAAPKAKADALCRVGLHLCDASGAAAMRAHGTIRPKDALQILKRLFLIMEIGAR